MRKVVVSVVVVFLLFGSIVYAAANHGKFEGYNIVKMKSDGKELAVEDTPAINFKGRTMIPIYMLRQLGVEVTWNADEYSVDVKLPKQSGRNVNSLNQLSEYIKLINDGLSIQGITTASATFNIDDYGMYLSIVYTIPATITDQKYLDSLLYMSTLSTLIDGYNIDGTIIETRSGFTETGKIYIGYNEALKYINGELDYNSYVNTWKVNSTSSPSSQNATPNTSVTIYPELYSNDGKTYLGKLTTNKFDTDSVFNEYGTYGSEYSEYSIWNEYGLYGSDFSMYSAFNDLATKPPIIVLNGKTIAHLTTNDIAFPDAISPYELYNWLTDNGY